MSLRRFATQIFGYRWKTKFSRMRILPVFTVCCYILGIVSADKKLECPANNSIGIYPNCTCQHKNFDYSSALNLCFRVCPENSSGYWPKCNCDSDGYVFDKEQFSCIACPADSTGQYPDCNCGDDKKFSMYENVCKDTILCPYNSNGKFPDCTCKGDGIYNELENECDSCPIYSTGIYPDCICTGSLTYNGNICIEKQQEESNSDSKQYHKCPTNSTGEYPNCGCDQPFHQYIQEDNICVGCPENSEGVYPHCNCLNGYFSQKRRTCIECPTNAAGFYPGCQCDDENLVFSAYINQCYLACPENSSGIKPLCTCDDLEYYYDRSEEVCKSEIGRMCPSDSIGIGPDCLCIRERQVFHPGVWECLNKFTLFLPVSREHCPDDGKWPQCESPIDITVLRSAVG